ncbi:hypothetical protein ACF07Y_36690 [Streptomyces sp. NPDC016566]|uniref:hypothetical protein n=1 Tax=Streptomyces sp. NPDC016566 TaxID=3364967 RepID=UPI0036FB95A4
MPVSLRAAALRVALESALNEPVYVIALPTGYRVIAAAPGSADHATWQELFDALRLADRWGSTDTADTPEVWAEVDPD